MADIIQLRRDTAANWTSNNPTLANGEFGYETDTDKMKIGDGSTAWTSLGYWNDLTSATETITAGESLVSGNVVQLKSTGKYNKTDANAEATSSGRLVLSIATISADATGNALVKGDYTTTGLTAGDTYFIDGTAGAITNTKSTTAGDIVRIIGYAKSTTVLYFNPSDIYIKVK